MSQEQEDIQRLIARARRARPDDEALARVWQRLQAPPPGPGDGGIEAPDPSALADATEALAGKAAIAAGLKTIAVAAALGAAIVGGRWWTTDEPNAAREPAIVAVPVASPQPAGPEEPVTGADEVTEEPTPNVAAPASPTRRGGRAPVEDTSDPERERGLVEAAQAALKRGDSAAALVSVEAHARSFPRGLLADEREVLRVLALCAGRREAEAEAAAQALLAASGPGLFLPRLRASCVGERLAPLQRPRGE